MDTLEMHQEDLERQLTSITKDLASAAKWLQDRMASVVRNCEDGGGTINSSGEVQSLGLEVDRLCALRAAKVDELRRVQFLVARINDEKEN